MVMAERERGDADIYDPQYGKDEDDLSPLERGAMSIKMGGDVGGSDDRYAYSKLIARQADLSFEAFYDFIKDYVPRAHRTKVLVNDLVQLCQDMINSPANRRKLRLDLEDARAAYRKGRLGKDQQDAIDRAELLLTRYGRADLLQILIRRKRIKEGLAAVERERARWHTATRKKELLEQMATRLAHPAYEYFQARKEQYDIQRELAEDRAKGIPAQDFSNLIGRIQDGKATEAEILTDSPWPFFKAFAVCAQEADVDNPHWAHIRKLYAAAAESQRSRGRNRYGSKDGGGDDA